MWGKSVPRKKAEKKMLLRDPGTVKFDALSALFSFFAHDRWINEIVTPPKTRFAILAVLRKIRAIVSDRKKGRQVKLIGSVQTRESTRVRVQEIPKFKIDGLTCRS